MLYSKLVQEIQINSRKCLIFNFFRLKINLKALKLDLESRVKPWS